MRVLDRAIDRPEDVIRSAQGILLPGGGDVMPSIYGEAAHRTYSAAEPGRDDYELELARRAVEADVPLLGICRGIQVLNVARGGSLVQDIQDEIGVTVNHTQRDSPVTIAHGCRATTPRLYDLSSTAVLQFAISRCHCSETLRKHEPAIDGATEFCFDRRRARRDLGRVRRRLDIDSDSQHDVPNGAFRQDAGELPSTDVDVVGPFYVRREPRRRRDTFGNGNTRRDRHQRCDRRRRPQHHRHVDAGARR